MRVLIINLQQNHGTYSNIRAKRTEKATSFTTMIEKGCGKNNSGREVDTTRDPCHIIHRQCRYATRADSSRFVHSSALRERETA